MAQQPACEFVVPSVKDETMSQLENDGIPLNAGKPRFIFGVSGHRDTLVEDSPELARQIQTVFDRFRLAQPNACFELLSPLAEGADRLAAEVALRTGIQLVVPLPMSQVEYEKDFSSAESLRDFRRLLAAATNVFEISSVETDVRASKYAAVGDYIAHRSHVLILLWDGQDKEKVGGTAWVKKRREYWEDPSKSGGDAPPVFGYAGTIQIVTPRRANLDRRPKIEIIGDLPSPAISQAEKRSKL
jgi:hypothetical protein